MILQNPICIAEPGLVLLPTTEPHFRGMNVRDNINSILEITEKKIKVEKIKLEKLLKYSDLENTKNSARLLSGGEKEESGEIARPLPVNPNTYLWMSHFLSFEILYT
ncbi:MAG: hypothetical protein CM15mP73_3270 [Hyphomicrobiales bacterium]|nr:MAG: hypothetical protein CM15mP73_3270 [Hyphomicrobiales bacterium]